MGNKLVVTIYHYGEEQDPAKVLTDVMNAYAQGFVLVVEYFDGKKEMYPFEIISSVEIVPETA